MSNNFNLFFLPFFLPSLAATAVSAKGLNEWMTDFFYFSGSGQLHKGLVPYLYLAAVQMSKTVFRHGCQNTILI
jgi:hypothetical protein